MNNFLRRLLLGATLLVTSMFAQAEFKYTGNIGFMSDYVYRGVHQSSSAAMGGIDVTYGNFYAGTWIADLQEGGWNTGTHRGFEYDLYAGYSFALSESLTGSIGYTAYRYSDKGAEAFDNDYDEVNLGFGYKASDALNFSVSYAIGEHDNTSNVENDYDVLSVKADYMGIYALVGVNGIKEDGTNEPDGKWFEVGYGRTVGDFVVTAGFVFSEDDIAQGSDTNEDGDTFSRFIMSIKNTF